MHTRRNSCGKLTQGHPGFITFKLNNQITKINIPNKLDVFSGLVKDITKAFSQN